jgi:hypothetical protein
MNEAVEDDIVAVPPPFLQSLEALGFIARHLNPPDFETIMEAAGTPDQTLQAVRSRLVHARTRLAASDGADPPHHREPEHGDHRLERAEAARL